MSRTERALTPRAFWIWLLILGALAASLRLAHLASIRGTPFYRFDRTWPHSDMHANREWAGRLALGDWLERDAYRPVFDWNAAIADGPTWERWLGRSVYYQPPLYVYLLALAVRATGGADAFRIAQALLGAVNVVLLGLLGRRVAGPLAGLIAALLAAAYAPFIMYDAELLRGTLVIALHAGALLALHRAASRTDAAAGEPGRAGVAPAWILAGALLGAAYLADSGVVTFVPLALLWAGLRGRAATAGWTAAGLAAALLPLAARNAVVGAPLLSTTTRAPLAFVMGNAPGADPVGAAIPESAPEILRRSGYGTARTIVETIRAHGGDVAGLLEMQGRKLLGLFNSYEVPDNPSFYYASLRSPVLAWGLRFACLSGLGCVGLILAARRPRENALMYLYLLGFLALFLMAHVVSRYRQPLVIPLAVYAGAALSEAWRAARERRPAAAAAVAAAGAAVSFLLPHAPPAGYRYYRPAEFVVAARAYESEGDVGRAAAELRQAASLAATEGAAAGERVSIFLELGALHQRHERYPEALSAYQDALDLDPGNAAALAASGAVYHVTDQPMEALQTLLKAEEASPDNAEVQARLGHLYWTVTKDASKARPHLQRALDLDPEGPNVALIRSLLADIDAAQGRKP